MPWFKFDSDVWLEVSEAIPKPWPPKVIQSDLEYWDSERRRAGIKRPSKRQLAARWGVHPSSAQRQIKAFEGREPLANHLRTSSEPVANHQRTKPNEQTPEMEENRTTSEPPANHLRTTCEPLANHPYECDEVEPSLSGALKKEERRKKKKKEEEENTTTVVALPKKETAEQRRKRLAAEVYAYWRDTFSPTAAAKVSAERERQLVARMKSMDCDDFEAAERCKRVVAWIAEAPDARWWRDNRRTGFSTLFKANKWEDRVESAEAYHEHGARPVEDAADRIMREYAEAVARGDADDNVLPF